MATNAQDANACGPLGSSAIFLHSTEWSVKRGANSVDKFVLETVRNAAEYERFPRLEAVYRNQHI